MKIKTSFFYSLAAASLLGGVANAQNDSATDPVGFHTINVSGADANGPRFSLVCPGLVNPIEYASGTTSITATTITVEGTPFAGVDYGINDGTGLGADYPQNPYVAYYVEVTSGAEAGAWANITANDDSSLTVDRDLSAAGAEKIAIRKHVTINDFFGEDNAAGIKGSDDASTADQVQLFANGVSTIIIFDDVSAGFEGWWLPDFSAYMGNAPIEPQQGVLVRRIIAGDIAFTRAGHVKVGPTKLQINPEYNAVANPRAVGVDDNSTPVFTLATSGLYNDADQANSVVGSDDAATADEVIILQDNGTSQTYIYDNITAGDNGWFTPTFDPSNDVVLENGKGFLLRRKTNLPGGGAPFVWTVPAETIAP